MPMDPMFSGADLEAASQPPTPPSPDGGADDMTCPTCGASASKILAQAGPPPDGGGDVGGVPV